MGSVCGFVCASLSGFTRASVRGFTTAPASSRREGCGSLAVPAIAAAGGRWHICRLHAAELVDAARLPGGLGLWFLTELGTEAIELIPSRPERRRKQITHAQATGPLRHHALAVNEVGLAFVRAARARGDECGPLAWRHEIAHPIGPAPGRRTPEQLIADALLTYQRNQPDGTTTFHYRFIELDRATMPVDDLAAKLARYATLYHHTLPPTGPTDRPRPLWTHSYAIFPAVLLVRDRALPHQPPAHRHAGREDRRLPARRPD